MAESSLPRRWQLALVLVVLVAAAVAWILVPALYPIRPVPGSSPEVVATLEASATQAVVTTRASVLAALAGLGALVTIWINYRNSRVVQNTFRLTERGHHTDRYTAAIGQLGDVESVAVRLGGIYALEQLARDSGLEGDHRTVVEVLSAFIRMRRAVDGGEPQVSATPVVEDGHDSGVGTESNGPPRRLRRLYLPLDVQAALTVLGRLPRRESALPADLRETNLVGADLRGLCFDGALLDGVNLFRARLHAGSFVDADLSDVNLESANLTDAIFTGSSLERSNLRKAVLVRTDMCGTKLTRADFEGAYLSAVRMTGAGGYLHRPLTQGQRDGVVDPPTTFVDEPSGADSRSPASEA